MCSRVLWMMLLISMGIASFAGSAETYVAYHDCTGDTRSALVVSNLSEQAASISVRAYDAYGGLLAQLTMSLPAHGSDVATLNDAIETTDAMSWGLVRIESDVPVALALWMSSAARWEIVENVAWSSPTAELPDRAVVLQTIDYANTLHRTTGVSVINPSGMDVGGTMSLYDRSGANRGSIDFTLGAYQARYLDIAEDVPATEDMWGAVSVVSDAVLLLVGEYFSADRTLIDIDLVREARIIELQGREGGLVLSPPS